MRKAPASFCPGAALEVRQHEGVRAIPAAEWDRLAGRDNPFLRHAWLAGLEEFDCLGAHGWIPCPFTVSEGGRLAGAALLYLRTNSTGEFVFDWAWADAYERAGGRYYPKLVSAIPFTPVRGPRFLVDPEHPRPDAVRGALLAAVLDFCEDRHLSSFHCLFPGEDDCAYLGAQDLLSRLTCQFHWFNRGYRDFDDFLDALNAKRRKQIRRERREVRKDGIEVRRVPGREVTPADWATFHGFYCSTFERRWGSPRLTLPFFESLGARMPDETLLILAHREGRCIAGAFAMCGDRVVHGRHWGCSEERPFLHFELCYYQTVEHCIERGMDSVDAGVQGEHKVLRGFEPVALRSFHFIRHAAFRNAVRRHVEYETREVEATVDALARHLPWRSPVSP